MTLIDPYHYYLAKDKQNLNAAELYSEIKYRTRMLPWPEFYQEKHAWLKNLVFNTMKFEPEQRPDIEEIQEALHEHVK